MADLVQTVRVVTWALHAVVALALLWLFGTVGSRAAWFLVPAILIACASVAASPGRPIASYAAFGSVIGLSFWMAIASIRSGDYLGLLPVFLLLAGVSWFLREPEWPSFLFSIVAIGLGLGLMALIYQDRFENEVADPDQVVRSVKLIVTMLLIGAAYLVAGFAEAKLTRARRRRKKQASTGLRTPSGPGLV